MTITRNFNLHLNAGASIPLLINANQYDSGEEWVFTLYSDRGVEYTPSSGAIIGLKSDGHAIANNATVNGSGQIVVTETEQMTASVGKNIYELSIDSGTHGTANFIVLVEPQPYDSSKASDSDISLFNEAINAAGEIEDIMGGETITEVISPVISDWLEDNMTNPSNPAIDTSLTVSGAAADAKKVGDELADLNEALTDIQEYLDIDIQNLFNVQFSTTHVSNWQIVQTGNDIEFTHLSSYTSGVPTSGGIELEAGTYNFSADYNGDTGLLALYNGTTYVKVLSETDTITINADSTIYLKLGVTPSQGSSVTVSDIKITTSDGGTGVIEQIESEITGIQSNITDIQNGFSDITTGVISALTADETINNKTINSAGTQITAGYDTYKIDKFTVTGGKTYKITGSANWGNLNWCFYKSDDSVSQLGDATASSATFTTITDKEVTAPSDASYILVTYNTTVNNAVCKTQTGYSIAKWKGKKWVCVGDSLTEVNTKTSMHYFDYVAEKTGITTVNMGVSGSGYARLAGESKAFYQRISSCPTDADVVTIFGSFNDLGAGLSIGSVDDTGTTTLAGCINTTIDNLQAIIPLVNLGIVAPCPWNTTQPATSGQAYNYVEMLKAICERRSIPFLDLWRCSNLRPWDSSFLQYAYSKDGGSGTHPDENGHKLLAPHFEGFLDTLLLA